MKSIKKVLTVFENVLKIIAGAAGCAIGLFVPIFLWGFIAKWGVGYFSININSGLAMLIFVFLYSGSILIGLSLVFPLGTLG